jgi:hypothetical protein
MSPESVFGSYFRDYTFGKAVPSEVKGTVDIAVFPDLTVLRWRIGNETIQTNWITKDGIKVLDNRTRTWRIWGLDSMRTIPWIFHFPRNLGPLSPWDENGSMREDWTMFNQRMRYSRCTNEDQEGLCVNLQGKTFARVEFGPLVHGVWPKSIEADDSAVGETTRMALVLRGHPVWVPENPDQASNAGDMAYLYVKNGTFSTTVNPELGGMQALFDRERRVWAKVESEQADRDRLQLAKRIALIAGIILLVLAFLRITGFRFPWGPKKSSSPPA